MFHNSIEVTVARQLSLMHLYEGFSLQVEQRTLLCVLNKELSNEYEYETLEVFEYFFIVIFFLNKINCNEHDF